MKNILVFFGGQSIEHEISVITGTLTLNSIDKQLFNAIPVFIDQDGKWWGGEILKDIDCYKNLDKKKLYNLTLFGGDNTLYLVKGKKIKPVAQISCAINCMHGERGEDGSLSGLLNMCNIPLASPSTFGSSLCISKASTKLALKGLKINALPYCVKEDATEVDKIEEKLAYPLIIKPDSGGSSIGIAKATNRMELKNGILTALRYSEKAIIEPMLSDFTEINCACYFADGKIVVSECEKPFARGDILSFNDKYKDGKREFPASIPPELSEEIKNITKTIYTELGFSGVIRVDYILKDGVVLVNEINTVPGSLAYYLFVKTLKEFSKMLTSIINQAITNGAKNSTLIKKFSSGILSISGGKGSKRLKK